MQSEPLTCPSGSFKIDNLHISCQGSRAMKIDELIISLSEIDSIHSMPHVFSVSIN